MNSDSGFLRQLTLMFSENKTYTGELEELLQRLSRKLTFWRPDRAKRRHMLEKVPAIRLDSFNLAIQRDKPCRASGVFNGYSTKNRIWHRPKQSQVAQTRVAVRSTFRRRNGKFWHWRLQFLRGHGFESRFSHQIWSRRIDALSLAITHLSLKSA